MGCNRPIYGQRGPDGKIKPVRAFEAEKQAGTLFAVPCGHCLGCDIDRSRSWALRMVHEAQLHDRNCFLTLTYNDEALATHQSKGGAYATNTALDKRDWQLFAKTLRRRTNVCHQLQHDLVDAEYHVQPGTDTCRLLGCLGCKFRYFHAGEYTDDDRPHLHACVFGVDFLHDRRYHGKSKSGMPVFVSQTLSALWPHGFAYIGDLTYQSAAYIARYVLKKRRAEPRDDRPVEYSTMSLKPAIAAKWFEKHHRDLFPHDFAVHDGKKHPTPTFYRRLLEAMNPELADELKRLRKDFSENHRTGLTTQKLLAREANLRAKIALLKRE